MSSTPFYMVGLIFFALFALLLPDIAGFATNYVKANNAASAIIDSGQKYGEIDRDSANQILTDRNLSPNQWSVSFTQSKVDFNEPMTVQVKGGYQIMALYMIGKAFGDSINSYIPINIQREAVGQVYRR
ncbi:DUF4320 family protein [Heyndrickxia sp. FSL W8-0496]|uniref:DUF4320 family protein n=1 Tax=Heyndrickxia TaxID=2837504 RepID=UPI0030F5938A